MCFVASGGKFHKFCTSHSSRSAVAQASNFETGRIAQAGNEKSRSIAVLARSDTQCTRGQSSLMVLFLPLVHCSVS